MRTSIAIIGAAFALGCAAGMDSPAPPPPYTGDVPAGDVAAAPPVNPPTGASAAETGGVAGMGGAAGVANDQSGTIPDPASAGAAGMSGAAGASVEPGAAGANAGPPPVTTSGAEPRIPAAPASCPTLATGNITVMGQSVQLWVGPANTPGPIVFYWHGTGSSSIEATFGLGAGINDVMAHGGVVASFTTTTGTGTSTGNNVWFTGDFEMADQILACAIAQGLADPRRIYAAGCSAGGLQAGAMLYQRSSYLAAAAPNSGGTVFPYQLEDPSHVPALITAHGAPGSDVIIIDFSTTSNTECTDIAGKGGFAVDCNHGGGHCGSPSDLKTAQWQFLMDHPFGVDPEPYTAGLPASFPSYCKVY